jgi:hypothetical protein
MAMPQPVTDVRMRAVGGEAGLADREAKMGQAYQAACRPREEQHDAESVLGKGSRQEELLSRMDGLRWVSGVRKMRSALANGSAESKPKQ